jgi:hypothetical protein
MFEGLGKLMSNWGTPQDGINPEGFAIIADMLGKNLDPNNAFAGIGTAFGQSSLANKAAQKQNEERTAMFKGLMTALSGGQQAAPPQGQPLDPNGQSIGPPAMGFNTGPGNTPVGVPNVTPGHQQGPTAVTYKSQPDGSVVQNVTSNTAGIKPATGVNLGDLLPLFLAQSGNTPANLTGLTPEQIIGFARNDLAMGGLNNQTVGTLFDAQYRRALAKAEQDKVAAYNAEKYASAGSHEASMHKTYTDRLIAINQELRKVDLHPAERAKLEAEKLHLEAQTAQSYASAANSRASAAKTRQEVAWEDVRQKGMKGLKNIEDVSEGTQMMLLGSDWATYKNAKDKTTLDKTKMSYEALAALGDSDTRTADNVDKFNMNAPDEATFGIFWTGETGWGDGLSDDKPQMVALPAGYTMKDVRDTAAKRNMTVEQVLRMIYDAEKGR